MPQAKCLFPYLCVCAQRRMLLKIFAFSSQIIKIYAISNLCYLISKTADGKTITTVHHVAHTL